MADIELVIKIPEKTYIWALEEVEKEFVVKNIINNAIANGTPLPKGHGRLGDLDSLIKAIEEKAKRLSNADTINGLCGAVALIFDEQTIIEADKESEETE